MLLFDEYMSIRSLLRIAKETGECSEYIQMMVEDAQIIRHYPDRIRTIHRETYRYAVVLGRSNSQIINNMKARQLQQRDFIRLLEFFDSL